MIRNTHNLTSYFELIELMEYIIIQCKLLQFLRCKLYGATVSIVNSEKKVIPFQRENPTSVKFPRFSHAISLYIFIFFIPFSLYVFAVVVRCSLFTMNYIVCTVHSSNAESYAVCSELIRIYNMYRVQKIGGDNVGFDLV